MILYIIIIIINTSVYIRILILSSYHIQIFNIVLYCICNVKIQCIYYRYSSSACETLCIARENKRIIVILITDLIIESNLYEIKSIYENTPTIVVVGSKSLFSIATLWLVLIFFFLIHA